MPWFGGSGQSVKMGGSRSGVYWMAEDARGGRKAKSRRRRGSTSRHGDPPTSSSPPPPPAGILKRSGRGQRGSQPSFQFEEGMVPQEMAAAVPMPSEQSVNAMFSEMVVRKASVFATHARIVVRCLFIYIHNRTSWG